jgi:3-methyladenine DNA glycosylase AlkD
MDYVVVFEKYYAAADSAQAVKMSVYMRDLFPFLGIPTPKRSELSKEFLSLAKKNKKR